MRYVDINPDIFYVEPVASVYEVEVGSVIQFMYDGKQKTAIVLNPEWNGKLHALRLREIQMQTMQRLLESIRPDREEKLVLAKYKESRYVKDRPYRTYIIDKISNVRKVELAPAKPKPTPTPKKTIQTKPKEVAPKKYSMYEE